MANSNESLPARPKHILQLSGEERHRFLASFDHVFSDIDGVMWTIDQTVLNAPDGYRALERAGKQITYVTNNSVRTVDKAIESFNKLGLDLKPEQIWHPAQTCVHYLRSINFNGLIYIIATLPFKTVLRDAGFQLIDGPNHFIEETYRDLARNIFDKQPVRAVIMDMDFNLTTTKILRAHCYLRHPDCLLLSGASDRLLPVGNNVTIIGPGPFTSVLEEASGREAIVMGKPGSVLGKMLLQKHNITSPDRVLMIGDMLAQDIYFGRQHGFQTLVVLTGGCTLEQLQAEQSPDLLPDYYADSMADFVQLLAEPLKSHV